MTANLFVAALYVDRVGIYPKLPGVDPWDLSRDARNYSGPHPVVAHPPCKYWGQLRHLAKDTKCSECDGYGCVNPGRWERTCPMCHGIGHWSDRDCAPRAVEQVRAYGGVLEHPAGSKLWEYDLCPNGAETCGCNRLPRAERFDWVQEPMLRGSYAVDAFGGYTIEVDQCEWGHVARKTTWLYLVGVPRDALEPPPFPGRQPTHWISGFRTSKGRSPERYAKNGSAVPPGIKVCSAQQRRRTPPLFAEYLVRLARAVRR